MAGEHGAKPVSKLPFLWWKDEWYRDEVVYPRIRQLGQYNHLSNTDIARQVGCTPHIVDKVLGKRSDPLAGLSYLTAADDKLEKKRQAKRNKRGAA